jgi:plasmid stabilization system protein ParE
MTYQVVVRPSAQAEMETAYEWIAERAPMAAARRYNRLVETVASLSENPERCPLAPENDYFSEEIRNLFYGKPRNSYRVLFTIRGQTVHELPVRRGAQQVLPPETEEPH